MCNKNISSPKSRTCDRTPNKKNIRKTPLQLTELKSIPKSKDCVFKTENLQYALCNEVRNFSRHLSRS